VRLSVATDLFGLIVFYNALKGPDQFFNSIIFCQYEMIISYENV